MLPATEGFQVPVIPLSDVVDKTGTLPPSQMSKLAPKGNVGVISGLTVTANDVSVAH